MHPGRNVRLEWSMVLALTLLALLIRVYQLQQIPPGLYFDEAANGVDAQGVLTGTHSIFFERNYGREPLLIYLQAISIAILGATPFALRLTSAILGALTVPAVYWMVREAFHTKGDASRWLALWTALFVALSYWHINFSRIGFRAILVPLLASLAFACFWRAWRHVEAGDRFPWLPLIGCGLFVGISLYTYTAARFLPVLIVAVVLAGVLGPGRSANRTRRAVLALVVIGVTALALFTPLGAYFLSHPDAFFGRAEHLSVFNPENSAGSVLTTLFTNVAKTVGMFGWAGDPQWLHNPAERPLFDPILALWLAAGVILAIIRWRSLPTLSALFWCILFALPAILTALGMPHSLRTLGMIPAVYLLPVLAMWEVGKRLTGRWRWLASWLPLPFLLISGITSIHDYYTAWEYDPDHYYAFHTVFADAAESMTENGEADGVWIMPIGTIVDNLERLTHYTVDFLYRGQAGHGVVVVDSETAPARLNALTQGRNLAYLIRWKDSRRLPIGGYTHADPKGVLAFLLRKNGNYLGNASTDEMSYAIYQVPSTPDYRIATTFTPQDVSFAGTVRLTGAAYGHTAINSDEPADRLDEKVMPSGHSAWVVLQWEAQKQIEVDLKTTLYLIDQDGHRAGQVDDLLVSDSYPFVHTWQPGEKTGSYHILSSLPAIPPGQYQLYLGVYDDATQQRFPILETDGETTHPAFCLGTLEITSPANTPAVVPGKRLSATGIELAPGVTLLGYDLPAGPFGPGQRLPVTLYWQAGTTPEHAYQVNVELRDADGQPEVAHNSSPANGRYPMTEWSTGEILRDWHDLDLPTTLPQGDYTLIVALMDNSVTVGEISLETIAVRDRPHAFELPEIQHSMNLRVGNRMVFSGLQSEHGKCICRRHIGSDPLLAGSRKTHGLLYRLHASIECR